MGSWLIVLSDGDADPLNIGLPKNLWQAGVRKCGSSNVALGSCLLLDEDSMEVEDDSDSLKNCLEPAENEDEEEKEDYHDERSQYRHLDWMEHCNTNNSKPENGMQLPTGDKIYPSEVMRKRLYKAADAYNGRAEDPDAAEKEAEEEAEEEADEHDDGREVSDT